MSSPSATDDAYFDAMWAVGDDPWDHGGRWYEERKYGLTVAALPRARYRRAFEPGCGAGFLTRLLAERVDQVWAMERAARGVAVTRRRCADQRGVHVVQGRIPTEWPPGRFDLVVLSEVLYYLDDEELEVAIERAGAGVEPGGHLVAVHYRLEVPEHARSGDEVHQRLREVLGDPSTSLVEEAFRLEVFDR